MLAMWLCAGLAYCTLPLFGNYTGLHVHVNGFFELSQNRRDIWYGDDLEEGTDGRTSAEWNKALLKDSVAPAYAEVRPRHLSKTSESEEGEALEETQLIVRLRLPMHCAVLAAGVLWSACHTCCASLW